MTVALVPPLAIFHAGMTYFVLVSQLLLLEDGTPLLLEDGTPIYLDF